MERISKTFFNWASILEDNTRAQAETTASMPFIYPHLALMPDAHLGKGATVGSVIPTLGAIIPAAVGVDIGCGMIAVKTQYHLSDIAHMDLADLRERIEKAIPLSAGKYNDQSTKEFRSGKFHLRVRELEFLAANGGASETKSQLRGRHDFDPEDYSDNWRDQLGTLGSGNHFIEVSVDEEECVWFFLHSGSRGVGNRIAQHHIKVAQELNKRWYIDLPDPDLAYLIEGTPEFRAYITELRWAQHFALLNREEMMGRVINVFNDWSGLEWVEERTRINCHHNFTELERHFGKEVWLSRKGAIDASDGTPGLIPGSMGDASYIVVGKGNRLALNSSPHGAGRVHSRTAARKLFTQDQLRERMAGIEYRDTNAFIDEHPGAYKPIDQVMADSVDLVEIRHTLRQIVNVKGD